MQKQLTGLLEELHELQYRRQFTKVNMILSFINIFVIFHFNKVEYMFKVQWRFKVTTRRPGVPATM